MRLFEAVSNRAIKRQLFGNKVRGKAGPIQTETAEGNAAFISQYTSPREMTSLRISSTNELSVKRIPRAELLIEILQSAG